MTSGRLKAHANPTRVLLWIALVTPWMLLPLTFMRSVGRPMDYALAHWLMGYHLGFVKRGLPGTMRHMLDGLLPSPDAIQLQVVLLAATVFAVMCAVLVAVSWRFVCRSGGDVVVVAAVSLFFSSTYMVLSGHMLGYFDHLNVIVTVGSIWLALRRRPLYAALLLCAGVFTQELIAAVGMPSVLAAHATVCLWQNDSGEGRLAAWRKTVLRGIPFLLPVVSFVAVVLLHDARPSFYVTEAQLQAHFEQFPALAGAKGDFRPAALIAGTFSGYAAEGSVYSAKMTSSNREAFFEPYNWLRCLPAYLALMACTMGLFPASWRWPQALLMVLLVGCCLAPNAVAWDHERFFAMGIMVLFLHLWACSEAIVAKPGMARSWGLYVLGAAAVVAAQMAMEVHLYEGATERFLGPSRALLYAPVVPGALLLARETLIKKRRYWYGAALRTSGLLRLVPGPQLPEGGGTS